MRKKTIVIYKAFVSSIRENHKLPVLKISKRMMSFYLASLIRLGAVAKKGYATYDLNEEVCRRLFAEPLPRYETVATEEGMIRERERIRGHAFQLKLTIPKLLNWHKRGAYLAGKGIEFYRKSKTIIRMIFHGHKIWLCDHSIIIYFPEGKDYIAETAEASVQKMWTDAYALVMKLESLFRCSFRINRKYDLKVTKWHFGRMKDEIAIECNKKKLKIKIYDDEDGKLRLLIDDSHSLAELETVHPDKAKDDMDGAIRPFIKSIEDNPGITMETVKINTSHIGVLADNWLVHSDNLVKHVAAINRLADMVDELKTLISFIVKKLLPTEKIEVGDVTKDAKN